MSMPVSTRMTSRHFAMCRWVATADSEVVGAAAGILASSRRREVSSRVVEWAADIRP